MKKLTESNKLLLQAVCLEMGIKGEVDDYGNVYNAIQESVSVPTEKTIFGIKFSSVTKSKTEKIVPVMTLQEIMATRLGIDYDPNVIIRSAAAKMLED